MTSSLPAGRFESSNPLWWSILWSGWFAKWKIRLWELHKSGFYGRQK